MKVILLKNDKKLGKKDDIIEVKDGYGLYLIKQKIAIQVTKTSLERLHQQQEENKAIDEDMKNKALSYIQKLENNIFSINKSYNSKTGKLNGSITKEDVVKSIKALYPDIDIKTSDFIDFPKVTSTTQTYDTKIKLYKNIIANVKFGAKI